MKQHEKFVINCWKDTLEQFVDPLRLIENLPEVFPMNSRNYYSVHSKKHEPHRAVEKALEVILESDNIYFDDFVTAVKECGHTLLVNSLTGEVEDYEVEKATCQIEDMNRVQQYLTLLEPTLSETLHAGVVSRRLLVENIITRPEADRIDCKLTQEGKQAGVIEMLLILTRKNHGWWVDFTRIVQDLNYDAELVSSLQHIFLSVSSRSKSLQAPTSDSLEEQEVEVNEEVVDMKLQANPCSEQKRTAGLQVFEYDAGDSSLTQARKVDGNEQLHHQRQCNIPVNENVVVCCATDEEKDTAIGCIFSNLVHLLQQYSNKIAFIVLERILAEQRRDEIARRSPVDIRISVLTGKMKYTLKDVMRGCNVVVLTAQMLLNSLKEESTLLTEFKVLILDECHRAIKDHEHNRIMSLYRRLQERGRNDLPQIIGLTTANNLSTKEAFCGNLGASEPIVIPSVASNRPAGIEQVDDKQERNLSKDKNQRFKDNAALLMRKTMQAIQIVALNDATFQQASDPGKRKGRHKFYFRCKECKNIVCESDEIVNLGTNYSCFRRDLADKYNQSKRGFYCTCKANPKLALSVPFCGLYIPQLDIRALEYKGSSDKNDDWRTTSKWKNIGTEFKAVNYKDVNVQLNSEWLD